MPVTITINGDDAGHALKELGGLSGGLLRSTPLTPVGELQQGAQIGQTADTAETTTRRGRKSKIEQAEITATPTGQNISTGGERVDPNEGKGAEVEKPAVEETKKLTLDDVRNAALPYIKKWTQNVAGMDLGVALKDAIGKEKISQLDPENQKELAAAVKCFTDAYGDGSNRYVPKGQ